MGFLISPAVFGERCRRGMCWKGGEVESCNTLGCLDGRNKVRDSAVERIARIILIQVWTGCWKARRSLAVSRLNESPWTSHTVKAQTVTPFIRANVDRAGGDPLLWLASLFWTCKCGWVCVRGGKYQFMTQTYTAWKHTRVFLYKELPAISRYTYKCQPHLRFSVPFPPV